MATKKISTTPPIPPRGGGTTTTVPTAIQKPVEPTPTPTTVKSGGIPARGSGAITTPTLAPKTTETVVPRGGGVTTPAPGVFTPGLQGSGLTPPGPGPITTTSTGRAQSPDLIEAQRDLGVAQATATRAGVPDTKIQGITTGKDKPNKGLVLVGKVIGFDIVPGKGEFKPVESLVFGPAAKLDVGFRAVISTLKEVGDEIAVYRGKRGRGEVGPATGGVYKYGPGGFSIDDWWRQTNDLATGYGSTLLPSPTGNKWVDRGIGLTGDIILNPLTYFAGPAGVPKQAAAEAIEAGGKQAATQAAIAAAKAAGQKTLAVTDDAGKVVSRISLEEAANQAAKIESQAAQKLADASRDAPRRVLGARTREDLAQTVADLREVAIKTGNQRAVSVLTDDVISDIATRGYSAVRGEVADVLGVRGGLRLVNPFAPFGLGPDKIRLIPQITEPFGNAIGTGMTGIRVGFPVKNLPRILSVINDGFVNTRLGNEILQGTTPIGEGGVFGTEQIQRMRVALRSGYVTDATTGTRRRLTAEEGTDYVRMLAEDRAFRLIDAQSNGDIIRIFAPTLANKGFFTYSNTIVDLLDRKIVNILPDGTKELVPAINLIDKAVTPADATKALEAAGLPGRIVSEEEFLFAKQIRAQLDEVYNNNNFLHQQQQLAAGFTDADLTDLPKNSSFFPHVLSDDARRAVQTDRMPQEALDAMEIDKTFALAGSTPRELKVGSRWFGTTLTHEDIAGGVKRLNEIARNSGRVNYDIFETNAENALTRYGQSVARDNAFTQWLYQMAQATSQIPSGPLKGRAFGDIIQTEAQRDVVGRVPTALAGFEAAVDAVVSPARVAYMSTDEGRKRVLTQLAEDLREFNKTITRRTAGNKTLFYDQNNYAISQLEQRIKDLERINPPVGYPSSLDSEGQALLDSLVNESKGIILNVNKVTPENWIRILPLYNSMFGEFLAINSKSYPGLAGSPEIVELLQNVRRLEDPKIAQALPKALQDTTQMFKAWVTATPGFHTRNALSNIFFMLSAGASPVNMSQGARYFAAYNKFLKTTEKAAVKGGKAFVKSQADTIVEDLILGSGRIPVRLIDSDPTEFNRLLDLERRRVLSTLGPGGKTLFDFYLSPQYMDFAGFPKNFNPYKASVADRAKWLAKVEETYNAVLANATGGYGLLGDVFTGGGRRGISGVTNVRTLRGAETLGEKVAGGAASVSRTLAKPLAWSKQAGGKIEAYTRFMLTFDALKQGMSPEAAAARTAKYLIDYQDLSQADKAIKQFIPFWTWTSRSFPLIVESAWLNPKAYSIYNSIERNLRDKEGEQGQYTPNYFGGAFKLPVGSNIYAVPDFGFQRQEEGLGRLTDPTSILSSLAPLYRAPIEASINQKFQTGDQVYNPYYENAATAQLQYLLQQILPQKQYVGRLGNVAAAGAQDPLTAALAAAGLGIGGALGGPAGAVLGGAAGVAAGTAGQGIAGQVPTPDALERLAQALQGRLDIPGTDIPLIQTGKPSYIEEEQGPFTREESRQKLLSYFGIPVQQIQDYQQVQRIKQIIERLEQESVKTKEKNK